MQDVERLRKSLCTSIEMITSARNIIREGSEDLNHKVQNGILRIREGYKVLKRELLGSAGMPEVKVERNGSGIQIVINIS